MKLEAEKQAIEDSWQRLTIWPLLQAGEFSTIADLGVQQEDLAITSGRMGDYIEQLVNKLPEGAIRTAGRYLNVSKDTALFRGMQKSVQYGDFISKAILYDHMTRSQKLTKKQALARISEEFGHYDRLPGRFRQALEDNGVLWFYNFKIRMMKVALRTAREHPLRMLLVGLGSPIDMPTEDSLINTVAEGTWPYSVGPGMGLRALTLHPWYNLVD